MQLNWSAKRDRATSPAGHRVFILSNPETPTRVVQVLPPPGGKFSELVVAVPSGTEIEPEAMRLLEMSL